MSYILDALRKSEQERRRGEVPDVLTDQVLGAPAGKRTGPGRGRTIGWLLAVLLLGGLGVAAWLRPVPPESGPTEADAAGDMRPRNAVREPAAASPVPSVPVTATPMAAAGGQSATDPLHDTNAAFRNRLTGLARAFTERSAAATSTGAPGNTQQPAAAPPIPARSAEAAGQVQADPLGDIRAALRTRPPTGDTLSSAEALPSSPDLPDNQDMLAKVPAERDSDRPVMAAADAPGLPTVAVPDPEPALPDVKALPWSVQKNLPDISLSVHIYSADPDKRLVRINGVSAREGVTLDDGLQVVSITPVGVELSWKGQRFSMASTAGWRALGQ